ncbi:hypothetical protein ccbrp13_56250 [Ktedonobacteria bacterium brp13]|nr:hypothetical protein ccbrp13_56250 [Ktedonobacteria bacterium brp13]
MSEVMNAQKFLQEFPGVKVFGMVNEKGKPLVDDGLVFAYKDRIIVMDVKEDKLEDYGTFLRCFSSMTLEERCMEIWHEYFEEREEA